MYHLAEKSTIPSIFIGSSSEGLSVARMLQAQLQEFTAEVWDQGLFTPGNYPMETLSKELRSRDFAILVCTPDDLILKRSNEVTVARDNVIFELGLFMGVLGRERTFIVVPSRAKIELPSDLCAITQVRYDNERFQTGLSGQIAAIQIACMPLRSQISILWNKIQASRAKLISSMTANDRMKALRRLHTVIVQMRDLIIIFPGQLLDSLSDQQRFETVKLQAAGKVDSLVASFQDDALASDLVPELAQLANATKLALTKFPFPVDPAEVGKSLRTAVVGYGAKIITNIVTKKDALSDIGDMVEREIENELKTFVDKYEAWWRESRLSIETATTRLHDSLMTASFMLNERLLFEHMATVSMQ